MKGIILKGVGGKYTVACGGEIYSCSIDGKVRIRGLPPVCGDFVEVERAGASYHISSVLPRKNALIRPAIANIDMLFIVASNAAPKTDPYLIDKLCVIAACKKVKPVIVLNKTDLDGCEELFALYSAVGFDVVKVSALTEEGIDSLRELVKGHISAFTGNSGIGKSSILNCLDPSFSITVGEISAKIERGKQTTRHVELLPVSDGFVADTPGFSSFEIANIEQIAKGELQYCFPEISGLIGGCRFTDCVHINEPECAVKAFYESHPALASRYQSYKKIYAELAAVKQF